MNCSSAGRLCYILVSTSGRAKDQTYELKGRIHSECQQPPTNPLHCLLESFHSSGSAFLTPCASVFQGVSHCLRETAKLGPLAFYKVKKKSLTAPLRLFSATFNQMFYWSDSLLRSPLDASIHRPVRVELFPGCSRAVMKNTSDMDKTIHITMQKLHE